MHNSDQVKHDLYKAENADKVIRELFSGKLSVEQTLQSLRTRLLDLSSRNRLLNFRFPKARSIQFVNRPNLNAVFNRLIDHKSLIIKYVPDMEPGSYYLKRPEPSIHAQTLKINIDTEFPEECCESSSNKRTTKLQALYYPTDLEKLCRKIGAEARTVIEETGTNMLYLVFGFLEFHERQDSNKMMLAPLLAVPVTLQKGSVDRDTRTYQYSITYSGEDINENQTLREKLSRDFTFQLPEFQEEEDPGSYFQKIKEAVATQNRWRVSYQVALGFLSFGKLAIWDDLDPVKWPGLLRHPLLKDIFSGGNSKEAGFFAPDYDIDSHGKADLELVYDADSSQHSAIIDVLSGKNMVINGPPGTGKSQTITNIIAAAIKEGKKILFVSEKLAALEVVRRRLNQVNLGHFCLELHSHKTQKKKLLGELQERLDKNFRSPHHQFDSKLTRRGHLRTDLNGYAEVMKSRVGNKLGLTVYQVFWLTETHRQAIGELANEMGALVLDEAQSWTLNDVELRKTKLETLQFLHKEIGGFCPTHPWWGFTPKPLTPGDDSTIGKIVNRALESTNSLVEAVMRLESEVGSKKEPALADLENLQKEFKTLPVPSDNLKEPLLPRLFGGKVEQDENNRKLLSEAIDRLGTAQDLMKQANTRLRPNCELSYKNALSIKESFAKNFDASILSAPLEVLNQDLVSATTAILQFQLLLGQDSYEYVPIHDSTLKTLETIIQEASPLNILDESVEKLANLAVALSLEAEGLKSCLARINSIVQRFHIKVVGSLASFRRLEQPDGIEGLLPGVSIDKDVLYEAQKAADNLPNELPIKECINLSLKLNSLHDRIRHGLDEMADYATQISLPFDSTDKAIHLFVTMAQIASKAPKELLEYRRPTLNHPSTMQLVNDMESQIKREKTDRESISQEFYLDSLPSIDQIKAATRTFRRGDSIFNIFRSDWRSAKKLFYGICKEKIKLKAVDYGTHLDSLVNWIELRESVLTNGEFKSALGPLFKGLETDFSNIRCLMTWYKESRNDVMNSPFFIDSFDISSIDSRTVNQLSVFFPRLKGIKSDLDDCHEQIDRLVAPTCQRIDVTPSRAGWASYNEKVRDMADKLKTSAELLGAYIADSLTPNRALELLKARSAIIAAHDDIDALVQGTNKLSGILKPLAPSGFAIDCDHLNDYIDEVWRLENAIRKIVEFLSQYSSGEATLSNFKSFCKSKVSMDAALQKVAIILDTKPATDWRSFVLGLDQKLSSGLRLVKNLKPATPDGISVPEVILGLKYRKDANDIVEGVKNSRVVKNLVKEFFNGLETDLHSLASTLHWGETIIKNRTLDASIKNALLRSTEALSKFNRVKDTLDQIVFLYSATQNQLAELNALGVFNWDAWHSSCRSQTRYLFATDLKNRLEIAVQKTAEVLPWARYISGRKECIDLRISDFVSCLEGGKFESKSIVEFFEFVTYRSIGRRLLNSFSELKDFTGATHDQKRKDFVSIDQEIINLTGNKFAYEIDAKKKLPTGESGYYASDRTEMQLLSHEFGKQRRHLPIRQLIKRAGRAIQELKPCFMMGPMSAALYLQQGTVNFDLVVMDEASQLRPEEAIGAIARGKQLVVVGDPKQLPPTTFFDRMLDSGDDNEDVDVSVVLSGAESILDICQQIFHPVRTLRWHYRSQHESLITFSNSHFYNGQLLVFPSPFDRNRRLGVRSRYVKDGNYNNRQNLPEAIHVVDAIVERMKMSPDESLGVVTLNQPQRELIEDLLDKKMRSSDEVQAYISLWEEEGWPFFIKNLENVQGDERDVIFISTTFGKASGTQKIRQNFGPISRPDGWRRLNVLFTRARKKVELFTSMLPEDISVDGKTPAGTKALKDYLDFAKRGTLASAAGQGREPESDFEVVVGNMLRSQGFEVVPQLGVAGFFIDLAVRDINQPGKFLAAVECDGPNYYSSNSARDRDRIRRHVLESLGWKDRICRVWSTDWFYDPCRETSRLLDFLEQRRTQVLSEPAPDYDFEDAYEETGEDHNTPISIAIDERSSSDLTHSSEEEFVEVGDKVRYCFIHEPEKKYDAVIVETESNPKLNLINENAPLAQALLNSAVGDESELEVKGEPPRFIRILRIHRRNGMLAG